MDLSCPPVRQYFEDWLLYRTILTGPVCVDKLLLLLKGQ